MLKNNDTIEDNLNSCSHLPFLLSSTCRCFWNRNLLDVSHESQWGKRCLLWDSGASSLGMFRSYV